MSRTLGADAVDLNAFAYDQDDRSSKEESLFGVDHLSVLDFPSPANEVLSFATPEDAATPNLTHPYQPLQNPLPEPSIPTPDLHGVLHSTLSTPDDEKERQDVDLDPLLVGVPSIPSQDASDNLKNLLRPCHRPQPPSFEILGIAAPQLDSLSLRSLGKNVPTLSSSSLSNLAGPIHEGDDRAVGPCTFSNDDNTTLVQSELPFIDQSVETHERERTLPLLHPDSHSPSRDNVQLLSQSTPLKESIANDHVPQSGVVPETFIDSPETSRGVSPARQISPSTMAIRSTPAEPRSEPPVEAPQIETDNVPAYLEEPLQLILQCLRKRSESPLSSVQVLSHALPSPDKTGHSFPAVLNALVSVLHGKEIRWINVFHAVHGQFRIADLPPGPPATPGPAIGGDDYFATRVFNSAVTVTDLQANTTIAPGRVSARRSASGNSNQPAALTAQARGPQPIVQPGTVNVALIERYIPPSSRAEYQDMFDPDGRSIICDRLAELSNDSGVLVLIYPTRDGATTFMNRYLKPLLDPLLRSLTVLNSFTADLAESIGDMDCGERMLCYQDSRFWMSGMCAALSKEGDSTYEMAYTGFTEVCPDRSLWAGRWWAGQEKPRIREMVQKYFREHHLRSESSGTVALSSSVAATSSRTPNTRTSAEIVEKIINGVVNNPYGDEKGEPLDSIEVGIFVIIKSRK